MCTLPFQLYCIRVQALAHITFYCPPALPTLHVSPHIPRFPVVLLLFPCPIHALSMPHPCPTRVCHPALAPSWSVATCACRTIRHSAGIHCMCPYSNVPCQPYILCQGYVHANQWQYRLVCSAYSYTYIPTQRTCPHAPMPIYVYFRHSVAYICPLHAPPPSHPVVTPTRTAMLRPCVHVCTAARCVAGVTLPDDPVSRGATAKGQSCTSITRKSVFAGSPGLFPNATGFWPLPFVS